VRSQRGALTVFLSIILSVMIFFSGAIVEGSRIRIAETQVKRALENAVGSVLAGYDSRLKEDYGLFALASENENYVTKQISFFTSFVLNPKTNLSDATLLSYYILNEGNHFWNLQDYNIDAIHINLSHSLNNNEVLEGQILEFMKYRAPIQIASRFSIVELQNEFKSISAINDIKTMKMRIDRQLAEIATELEKLDKQVKLANEFSKETVIGKANSLIDYINEYKRGLDNIDLHLMKIERVKEEIRNVAVGEGEEEVIEGLKKQLDELRDDLKKAEEKLRRSDKKIIKQDNSMDTEFEKYLTRNKRIKGRVESVSRISKNLETEVASLEETLANTPGTNPVFKEMVDVDIKNYRELIGQKSLEKLQNQAYENEETISSCLNSLSTIQTYLSELKKSCKDNRSNIMKSIEDSKEDFGRKLNDYNNSLVLKISDLNLEGSEEYDNVREEITKIANKSIKSMFSQMEKKSIPENIHNLLEALNGQEHIAFEEVKIEFDEEKKRGGMTENMQEFGTGIIRQLTSSKNIVYVNEYIMGIFKTAITQVEAETNFDENLRGEPKTERESFFDNEIEYIIFGSNDQKANFNYAITAVLGVRFIANLVYVNANPEMIKTASAKAKTAAALTGKFAVFTYPVVKSLVMSAYATKESVEDLDSLLKGETVPLMKRYVVSVQSEGVSPKGAVELNYEDYLYIFLMTLVNQDTKLDRISNLIQINMHDGELDSSFVVKKYHTYIYTEMKVSIKNIFLNLISVEELNTTKIGRHNINTAIMDGY